MSSNESKSPTHALANGDEHEKSTPSRKSSARPTTDSQVANVCQSVNNHLHTKDNTHGHQQESIEEPNHVPSAVGELFLPLKEKIERKIQAGEKFFSLEFFPPMKNKQDAVKLLGMMNRMGSEAGALFIDITWHAAGNPTGDTETSSMTIANATLDYLGIETMLHMTCLGKSRQTLIEYLEKAKRLGVRNILALRGDPSCEGSSTRGPGDTRFRHGVELVRLIKDHFGDYFSVAVAGYPRGHPEAPSHKLDLDYLKQKVDAGADFIITQLFFRADDFIAFVQDCRRIGIAVPIIPGLMPIQSYQSLRHIARLTQLDVPHEIILQMEKLKGNPEAIKNYGTFLAVEAIQKIFLADAAAGVHFYTMNREVVTSRILKEMCFWNGSQIIPLPWLPTANYLRCKEEVRPIFWSDRPRSYVFRSRNWKEFPCGRWSDSKRDKLEDLKEFDAFFLKSCISPEHLLQMWGEKLTSEEDVWKVFERYVLAEPDHQGNIVSCTPWSDHEFHPDVFQSQYELADVCSQGILVTKSQRALNGWPSDEPTHGWGPKGGRLFQKEYAEFFTSSRNIDYLLKFIKNHPTLNYHIISKSGDINISNLKKGQYVAAAWGIFPGWEVVQPVIVDRESFKAWKDEAFALWTETWASLYPPDSESRRILTEIAETYILVYLLDEDFTKPTTLYNSIDGLRAKDREKFTHQRRSATIPAPSEVAVVIKNAGDISEAIAVPNGAVDVDVLEEKYDEQQNDDLDQQKELSDLERLGAVGGPVEAEERPRAPSPHSPVAGGWELVGEHEDRYML